MKITVKQLRQIIYEEMQSSMNDGTTDFMENNELIKAGINLYTGREVDQIRIYQDPYVPGTFAVRCALDDEVVDLLITDLSPSSTVEDVAENIEEVEFTTWPPRARPV